MEEGTQEREELPMIEENTQEQDDTPPSIEKGKKKKNEKDQPNPSEREKEEEGKTSSSKGSNSVLKSAKRIQQELKALVEAAEIQATTLERN